MKCFTCEIMDWTLMQLNTWRCFLVLALSSCSLMSFAIFFCLIRCTDEVLNCERHGSDVRRPMPWVFFYRNKCARKTNKLINHFFLTSPRHESISQFVVGSGVARAKKAANKLRINNDFPPFDCATPLVEFMNCIGINCQPRKCYKLITKSGALGGAW